MECENCTLRNCLFIKCNLNETSFTETVFDKCQVEQGCFNGALLESCHFIETIFDDLNLGLLGSAVIIDSKFSNSEKSIKFKGDFYLINVLQPVNKLLFK